MIASAAVQLSHSTRTGEDLDLRKGASVLGPRLTLRGCRVRLPTSARSLTLVEATLIDCAIEAARPFTSFQGWCRARIERCRFRGRFVGNDFGRWPEAAGELGSIVGSDFREAQPDGCRFLNVERAEIELPGWPFLAIERPTARLPALQARPWPGTLRYWIDGLGFYPPEVSFVVIDATTVAPAFGATAEELRDALDAERSGS